jgi:hypothetical protein
LSGARERRREERRKRKLRAAERQAELSARSEARNEQAREALDPLREGERPLVVTIGAVVSGLIALSIIGAYAFGAEVDGERPRFVQVLAPTLLMGLMSWGMWRARYWAVLGFQVVLLFLILGAAVGLLQAVNAWQFVGRTLILVVSGAGFFYMVKALARIQMPKPPGSP